MDKEQVLDILQKVWEVQQTPDFQNRLKEANTLGGAEAVMALLMKLQLMVLQHEGYDDLEEWLKVGERYKYDPEVMAAQERMQVKVSASFQPPEEGSRGLNQVGYDSYCTWRCGECGLVSHKPVVALLAEESFQRSCPKCGVEFPEAVEDLLRGIRLTCEAIGRLEGLQPILVMLNSFTLMPYLSAGDVGEEGDA